MTPEERAEKIIKLIHALSRKPRRIDDDGLRIIASQIREAVEDEIRATVKRCDEMHRFEIELAKAEAYRDAAKEVVKAWIDNNCVGLNPAADHARAKEVSDGAD
jgi:hypothetical protein